MCKIQDKIKWLTKCVKATDLQLWHLSHVTAREAKSHRLSSVNLILKNLPINLEAVRDTAADRRASTAPPL